MSGDRHPGGRAAAQLALAAALLAPLCLGCPSRRRWSGLGAAPSTSRRRGAR